MKPNSRMKRILSLLMVAALVFSLIPFTASAADTSRTADTIFFATDRHEESSKLNSLLQALEYEPGLVVLGGDHVNNTNSGSLASITSEIHAVYPNADTFFTYAAHDPNVSEDSSNPYAYARTGEVYEGAQYYVYGVDQNDMQSSSSASTASANFKSWAATADTSKVIFVMCHMPIHSRRGDNAGGATWMSALNEVGQTHDVVFLWGHNHTGESSADTAVYFVGVGGSLTPQGGSTGTINFTYMNAGYIKNGYASQVVINSDNVEVTRYTTSGSVNATHTFERRFAETHVWEVTELVAATCTEDGYTTSVCSDCGESKTTVLPATGHEYTSEIQDTCTGSYTVYTCSTCGYSYSEQNPTETTYDQATSLVEGESYVIVASNYALTYGSSAGRTSVTVSNGSITSDVKDTMIWTYENGMLSNSSSGTTYYIYVSSSSSSGGGPGSSSSRKTITFSTTGSAISYSSNKLKIGSYYLYHSSSSGFSARSSGSTVTLYQVNEALGATGSHTYETVTVEPTCTENGSVTYTCTSCGYSYSEVIEATGSHNYESVTMDATCTENGSITHTCTVCGDSYSEVIEALGHDYTAVVTAPTCTEAGYTTYTCACGHSYSEVIEALGHDYTAVVTDPTCTEAGYTTYTCACGHSYIADETAALGHSYETVTVKPTCTENGSVTYTCACGDSYSEVIEALGHDYTAVVTAPTCTEAGYTTYTCACGHSYTADETAALGHNYESVTVEPTCTEGGYTGNTCTICGDTTVTDETAALGHSYVSVVTEATCTEGGCTTHTCETCGDSYVSDETAALGHNYDTVTVDATCTENGSVTHTCANCGDRYSEVIAALGHSYETVTVDATCTEAGSVTSTCTICGDTHTEIIEALGHSYNAVVTDPTCTEGGYTTYTCACGHSYTADETAALGHDYESVTVEATCTENGSVTYTCACGDSYSEVIEAIGHNYTTVVTDPTCVTAGHTTHTCENCGDSYISDEVAALGHNYTSVTVDPTCTEDGYTTHTCSNCGDSYTSDEVAALGHNYEPVTVEPTCTENGSITYTCACGHSYSDIIVALGHDYTAVVTAPTCTEAGYTTYTCACGHSYVSDETAALGHSYSCVESDGYLVYTCDHCGDSYSEVIETGFSYNQTSAFTSGSNHVITLYSNGQYYALSHAGNVVSLVAVTVSDGTITSEVTEDLLWNYSGSKLSYVSGGKTYYLYASSASSGNWWDSFFGSATLTVSTSNSSTVSFSNNRIKVGNYNLRYSNGGISLSRFSGGTAYLFLEE